MELNQSLVFSLRNFVVYMDPEFFKDCSLKALPVLELQHWKKMYLGFLRIHFRKEVSQFRSFE